MAELTHHGVMGMKWGIRRYQNKDGSLTPAGKLRFKQVESTPRLSRSNTKQATKILKRNKLNSDAAVYGYEKRADNAYKKADKYVWTSEKAQAKGNQVKFEKYQSKAWKQIYKQTTQLQGAEKWAEHSKMLDTKINDIASGKIKAGKDFIVQNDYNLGLLPVPGGLLVGVGREQRIIERKKD